MHKYTGILVSHTHWDRAWYWSFQLMRARLVEVIDQILDVLESDKNFKCFVLDGQTAIIEDYLEVKPENRERIKRLVSKKKLVIGPWYVLMDEFLESPEAMIRNLLLGKRVCDELGTTMKEGYIPDSFGHIVSLPKILVGFGIRSVIFTRGMGKEYEELGNEFWWEASDGSKVLAIYQRDGYWNAGCLGFDYGWGDYRFEKPDFKTALEKIKRSFEKLKQGAKTKFILFNNGTDHAPIQPEIPEILKFINKNLNELKLIHGSFSDFVDCVLSSKSNLKTFKGELNKNYHHLIVQSVYSTRIYLKQKNFLCQSLLEKYAEPLSAILFVETGENFAPLILTAWKTLLKNHPHDDICGCGVDEIHKDMENRFKQVEELAKFIIWQASDRISSMVKTQKDAEILFVFNPLNFEIKEIVKAKLYLDEQKFKNGFKLLDTNGNEIEFKITSREREFVMGILKGDFKNVFEIEFISDLPAFGYKIFYIVPEKSEKNFTIQSQSQRVKHAVIENEFFKVKVSEDGTFEIEDKRNGAVYKNLNLFEDDEDAGDEYTYSHAENCQKIYSTDFKPKISIFEKTSFKNTIKIEYEFKLPKSLTSDFKRREEERVVCKLRTFVTLYAGIDRVDVKTEFENNVKDHRLRVLFPTGIRTKSHFVDAHFEILKRLNPYLDAEVLNPNEKPYTTRHQNAFVCLTDGSIGLMIANRGLPEYEILSSESGDVIALTLLRSVSYLSRKSLHRVQQAGPQIQTPDAQCLGKHVFEYSIIPINGDFKKSIPKAYSFAFEPLAIQKSDNYPHQKTLDESLSFLKIDSEKIVLSAIKIAEDGKGIIVRFYNISNSEEKFNLKLYRKFNIFISNLKEEKIKRIASSKSEVELTIKANAILTLYLSTSQGSS